MINQNDTDDDIDDVEDDLEQEINEIYESIAKSLMMWIINLVVGFFAFRELSALLDNVLN